MQYEVISAKEAKRRSTIYKVKAGQIVLEANAYINKLFEQIYKQSERGRFTASINIALSIDKDIKNEVVQTILKYFQSEGYFTSYNEDHYAIVVDWEGGGAT